MLPFLMGNFHCAPVRSVAVVTLERLQSLISNCAVVISHGTYCQFRTRLIFDGSDIDEDASVFAMSCLLQW